MREAVRSLTATLAYAATRPRHDARDRETVAALTTPMERWGLPEGLQIEWLGVAGFVLSYQGTTIVIDPYVSRAPLGALLRRRALLPEQAVIDRWVPRADAVLVGHTHFDHALDAPAIALRDDCGVYGGKSCRSLMGVWGLARLANQVEAHRPFEIGPFTVTFVPSVHSKLILGKATPSDGAITCDHFEGLVSGAYRCGEVWGIHISVAGVSIYHQGSADLLDDEVRHRDVDVFLCGVAGRQVSDRYAERILTRLGPRLVVVAHHDDFFTPLAAPSDRFAFGVDISGFPDEVAAVSREFRVVTPPSPRPVQPV